MSANGVDDASPDSLIGELNQRLLERVNATGRLLLSPTELDGRYCLRLAVGNLKTEPHHVEQAWGLLQEIAVELESELGGS